MTLDNFDIGILNSLSKDGRKPYSEIAKSLGISNTMVHQRIAKLKEKGILKNVSVQVDEKKMGYEWSAFTGLELKEDANSQNVIEALKEIPEVVECYFITGKYTLYIRVVAKNSEQMRSLIYEQIDHIPGVSKTESIVDFGTAFKRNVPLN